MLLIYLLLGLLSIQSHDTVPAGDFIIQLHDEVSAKTFFNDLENARLQFEAKSIFPSLNIYAFQMQEPAANRDHIESILEDERIVSWQKDHAVELRANPDDPLFVEQWNMQKISMPDAWNYGTGGTTTTGEEIVLAVLDAGFNLTHIDLVDNIWENAGEIPGDDIDNDLNGYVDDYRGVNLVTGHDDHDFHDHGTKVTGILGAAGNNNTGISGINWSVKIMLVSQISSESKIIEGYNYVLDQRRRYNASNGAEGAFVVSTNLSAGIDYGKAEEHPLWCQVYDALGSEGILNVTAVTNEDVDVDAFGDIPTVCGSDYLITVTSSDPNDTRIEKSGYGIINVDLAAPADPILTAGFGNSYVNFNGNSAAAPHVAGVVALMYNTPCEEFMDQVKADPSGAALSVKSHILSNVDLLPDFETRILSGGRLNAGAGMLSLTNICGFQENRLQILSIMPNPAHDHLTVVYQTPGVGEYDLRIYDLAGREIHSWTVSGTILEENVETFDLVNFTPGVYVISLVEGKSLKESVQFVVH